MNEPLLSVAGLTVDVPSPRGSVRLIDGFDLEVRRGERVALVGESGSGKSVFARSLMRLDRDARLGGSIVFDGDELVGAPGRRIRAMRGRRIGLVFQDPLRSLNPVMTIGAQVAEPLRLMGVPKRDAWARAETTLESLGVDRAGERMTAYPFEFSGGMRQRVALAIALVSEPDLLVADEPTTALDTIVQKRVLALLDEVAVSRGVAVLLITHDLGVVAGFADRVAVMYAGRNAETASVGDLYSEPMHPYTRGLLAAVPRVDRDVERLPSMTGAPVLPTARPHGCAFAARCPIVQESCREHPPAFVAAGERRLLACDVVLRNGKSGATV